MKKIFVPRKNQNDAQIRSYVKAVQAGQKMYHLIPNEGKWIVKKALAERASRVFENKDNARVYAIHIAKINKTELIIHGKDGRIQDRKSFENE
jgi:hypothetical protein